MTRQEKIEYLKQYRDAQIEAERIDEEIQRWRSLAEKTTISVSFMPSSTANNGNRIENAVENIYELVEKLNSQLLSCVSLRKKIGNEISEINNVRGRRVLRLRYIEGKRWERIAIDETISYQQVWNIHNMALEKLKIL